MQLLAVVALPASFYSPAEEKKKLEQGAGGPLPEHTDRGCPSFASFAKLGTTDLNMSLLLNESRSTS
jgi:hypothetical protein